MVDLTRLELVTFSMSRKRSNQLSYRSKKILILLIIPRNCLFILVARDNT